MVLKLELTWNDDNWREKALLSNMKTKSPKHQHLYFVHPIYHFWFLVTFGDEVTKTRNFYIIFVYILQDKMGKTEKNRKENHTTKVTKIPKTKNMGWREH